MTHKENIIQLVEQNILTMEEAIRLLKASGTTTESDSMPLAESLNSLEKELEVLEERQEALEEELELLEEQQEQLEEDIESLELLGLTELVAQKQEELARVEALVDTKEDAIDTIEDLISDVEDRMDDVQELEENYVDEEEVSHQETTPSIEDYMQQLSDKEAEKQTKEEALLIAKQRHRELEILGELDELSEELVSQQLNFATRIQELSVEISEIDDIIQQLNATLQAMKKEQFQQTTENFKQDIKDFVSKTTQTASKLNEPIHRHRLGKSIWKTVGNWAKNFSSKEFQVKVNVPWLEEKVVLHTYQFAVDQLEKVDVHLKNGDIKVVQHDVPEIHVSCESLIYGKDVMSVEDVEALMTLTYENGEFVCHSHSGTLDVDVTVMLPKQKVSHASFETLKGDVEVVDLDATTLSINGNVSDILLENIVATDVHTTVSVGDVVAKEVQAELLDIQTTTGDITATSMQLNEVVMKTVTGDVVLVGHFNNTSTNTMTGDIRLTKENSESANLIAKTQTGDIKIAVPQHTDLAITWQARIGDKKQRLSNVQEVGHNQLTRTHQSTATPLVTVNAATNVGDIYLKDTHEVK